MYKAKRVWCQVQGNQMKVSKSLFPGESHKMCLIPPIMSCKYTCEVLSPMEAC